LSTVSSNVGRCSPSAGRFVDAARLADAGDASGSGDDPKWRAERLAVDAPPPPPPTEAIAVEGDVDRAPAVRAVVGDARGSALPPPPPSPGAPPPPPPGPSPPPVRARASAAVPSTVTARPPIAPTAPNSSCMAREALPLMVLDWPENAEACRSATWPSDVRAQQTKEHRPALATSSCLREYFSALTKGLRSGAKKGMATRGTHAGCRERGREEGEGSEGGEGGGQGAVSV